MNVSCWLDSLYFSQNRREEGLGHISYTGQDE